MVCSPAGNTSGQNELYECSFAEKDEMKGLYLATLHWGWQITWGMYGRQREDRRHSSRVSPCIPKIRNGARDGYGEEETVPAKFATYWPG